jgi:hypothetical protein
MRAVDGVVESGVLRFEALREGRGAVGTIERRNRRDAEQSPTDRFFRRQAKSTSARERLFFLSTLNSQLRRPVKRLKSILIVVLIFLSGAFVGATP